MGAACCVAAKDRTIVHGPSGSALPRHVRHSPSWSFRWDNRVAGEEIHTNWLRDGGVKDDQVDAKSGTITNVETALSSEEGSPVDIIRLHGQKFPVPDGNAGISKLHVAGYLILALPTC